MEKVVEIVKEWKSDAKLIYLTLLIISTFVSIALMNFLLGFGLLYIVLAFLSRRDKVEAGLLGKYVIFYQL